MNERHAVTVVAVIPESSFNRWPHILFIVILCAYLDL